MDQLHPFIALIDDPILNSAFREPARHFEFDDDGITDYGDEVLKLFDVAAT